MNIFFQHHWHIGQLLQIDSGGASLCIKIEEVIVAKCGVLNIKAVIANDERHHALVRQIGGWVGIHLIRVEPHEIDWRHLLGINRSQNKGQS